MTMLIGSAARFACLRVNFTAYAHPKRAFLCAIKYYLYAVYLSWARAERARELNHNSIRPRASCIHTHTHTQHMSITMRTHAHSARESAATPSLKLSIGAWTRARARARLSSRAGPPSRVQFESNRRRENTCFARLSVRSVRSGTRSR